MKLPAEYLPDSFPTEMGKWHKNRGNNVTDTQK